MGIDANGSRFILFARREGVSYAHTLMVGRQGLHLTAAELAANLREFGHGGVDAGKILAVEGGFAEPFFRLQGAEEVCSLDASDFEGATHVHDLNTPVPESLKGRFTAVLDGGSLEHVFNFPQALKNCMEMVAVGGHYLGITPTSNFSGHGFYQLSPELYYRALSLENGFRVERMLLYEDVPGSPWYDIADPVAVQSRVSFINPTPSYLVFFARREAEKPVFARWPQQSDYSAAWASGAVWKRSAPARPGRLARLPRKAASLFRLLGFLLRVAGRYRRFGIDYPPEMFRPFDPHTDYLPSFITSTVAVPAAPPAPRNTP
jgi:hypothetical protein